VERCREVSFSMFCAKQRTSENVYLLGPRRLGE
jgi:hypothetical protein